MASAEAFPVPVLVQLPASLPVEGALRLELQEGIPIFRASTVVQHRIATLVAALQTGALSAAEQAELDQYEDLDDYLSFLNRVVRNLRQAVHG